MVMVRTKCVLVRYIKFQPKRWTRLKFLQEDLSNRWQFVSNKNSRSWEKKTFRNLKHLCSKIVHDFCVFYVVDENFAKNISIFFISYLALLLNLSEKNFVKSKSIKKGGKQECRNYVWKNKIWNFSCSNVQLPKHLSCPLHNKVYFCVRMDNPSRVTEFHQLRIHQSFQNLGRLRSTNFSTPLSNKVFIGLHFFCSFCKVFAFYIL